MDELNKFLTEIVSNCAKCQCCVFCHELDDKTNFCFFAYDCIRENFELFKGWWKENEMP